MTVTTQAPARTDYVALATELAGRFAERARQHDADGSFPHENFRELVDSGYTAMTVPREYGGGGAGLEELCRAQETLATGCASTSFAVNMHVHGIAMIAGIGGPAAEQAYRAIAHEGAVIAGGFSEPGVGGNWWHPTTKAEPAPGGYVLNGRKGFFTGYPAADLLFLSAARTDDRGLPEPVGFLVPKPECGVTVTAEWDAAGMRATGSHSLLLDNLFVAEDRMVGRPGALSLMFMQGVHWAWCSFASVFLGIARGALEQVVAEQRGRTLHVLDRTVAHLPGVQFRVAEMRTRLAAAEAHLYQAVRADHDTAIAADPLGHYIEMSVMKNSVARLAHEVVVLAMQVQGGSALLSGHPLQRAYRDVVAGLLVPPNSDVTAEWAGKHALGVPVFAEPRWEG
ncbi:acyl-CoA dehydrogenase family protein [Streptomyces sp. NPDC051172]|uniref:acyl-CoA dehydrogenase family protein n=1 Tax=Streptomyces sp. NPDC051172 TaxID=3155796 RepID=UPI003416E1BD